jgi:Co/Zn/Cd efflux system component
MPKKSHDVTVLKKINTRSLHLSLILGLTFLIPNIYAALSTRSLALWTNCFLSIGYILASGTALFAYKAKEHKKLERILSLAIAIFLLIIMVIIWCNIYIRLQQPVSNGSIFFAFTLLILYVIINSYMFFRTYYYGKFEKSHIILTQANIYLIKLILNIVIIASLSITHFYCQRSWAIYFDPACSLLLSIFIMLKAQELYKRAKILA